MTAQILLSAGDVAERTSYVNLRNAFDALFRLRAVPVVNENDATATDEITFGDNDALAAHTALLVRARLLVLLTEVEGVYSEHPATKGAKLLAEGEAVDDAAIGPATGLGRGGMASKIAAAQLAAGSGIPTVVASGHGTVVLGPIAAGEHRGTRFKADDTGGSSAYRLWLRHAKPAAGRIVVDAGARKALVEGGREPAGGRRRELRGHFVPGDAVELAGPDGEVFAKGIASAGAAELARKARGLEAVHRDRLVRRLNKPAVRGHPVPGWRASATSSASTENTFRASCGWRARSSATRPVVRTPCRRRSSRQSSGAARIGARRRSTRGYGASWSTRHSRHAVLSATRRPTHRPPPPRMQRRTNWAFVRESQPCRSASAS